jgi:hypothetical protein
LEALCNLATTTASDRKALKTLINTISNLTQQLKDKDNIIKKLQHTSSTDRTQGRFIQKDMGSYCLTHGYLLDKCHTSKTCKHKNKITRKKQHATTTWEDTRKASQHDWQGQMRTPTPLKVNL